MALCAFACSTSNVGDTLAPDFEDRNTAFAVDAESTGLGTYEPALSVETRGDATVVTVNATSARDLAAVAFNVKYDATRFSPERVEMGSFLGSEEEVLSFSLTNQDGIVPVSIVQANGLGALPVAGNGTLAKVYFRNSPFTGSRGVSSSPSGDNNRVDDLELTGVTTQYLEWTEKNAGDYNIDGVVSAQDLTPIGVNFGQQVATSSNPAILRIVDGSGDGTINVQDLTTIGVNFGHKITGYVLYTEEDGSPVGGDIWAVRAEQPKIENSPMRYKVEIDPAEMGSLTFWVAPAANDDLGNPGPKSNVAEAIVFDPGAPVAPSNLTAEGGETIGNRNVLLTWTPSTSNDIKEYVIEWKASTDPDTAFAVYATKAGPQDTQITVNNGAFTEQSYDFRIYAVDREVPSNNSALSNVASATPYIPPIPVVGAPVNVTAVPSGSPLSIDLTWEPNPDGLASRYRLYRKGPGDPGFSQILQTPNSGVLNYTDSNGLTEGQTYEYYLTGVDASSNEGAPGLTVSSMPSQAIAFEITNLTTSKYTHFNGGGEDPANLSLTCSISPDSVNWSANPPGSGSFSNQSNSGATWTPANGAPKGQVVITAQASKGAQNDSATITLIVTDLDMNTTDGGVIGAYPDLFSGSYLEPLADGGAISTKSLSEVTAGKVVLMKKWESW
ncbi:hypothetical protein IT575_15445 [bacterium]|nr:hypothetical protein [bacterium]